MMAAYDKRQSASKSRIRSKQRISHTKSRNGCYTCKQRHVKCDEERPICGACSVRGENCSFPNPKDTRHLRRRQQPQFDSGQPQGPENIPNISFRPLYFDASSSAEAQYIDGESKSTLNLSDLNLLQHYILYTSKRMTLHKSKAVVWEYVIPEMAASNEFLMHLVLALAGLDILTGEDNYAKTDPKKSKCFDAANLPQLRLIMEHHQQGLTGFQEALCFTGEPDVEALLAGSLLVVGFGFASFGIKDLDPAEQEFQDNLSSTDRSQSSHLNIGMLHIQWLQLVRGVTSILNQFWPAITKCRLRALLFFNYTNEDWKFCEAQLRSGLVPSRKIYSKRLLNFATGANDAVSELHHLITSLFLTTGASEGAESSPSIVSPQSDQSSNVGNVSLDSYSKVIDVLEDLYMRILYLMHMKPLDCHTSSDLELQADLEDAAISGWPHLLPEEFITSLDSRQKLDPTQGVSLVILAHLYLTIAILDEIWYYGRRCDVEIYKIYTLVRGLGDEKLILLMTWPMSVIQE